MPSRRRFLAGLSAASLSPSVTWAAVGAPAVLSAARTPSGAYCMIGLSAEGTETFRIPLPSRGHAAAAHPTLAEAVAIARRPGTFALVLDCATGKVRQSLTAPTGRHFYGHGAFTADGSLLLPPENDIATGEGRIGIWDRQFGYARVDDIPSHGVGPHEILRLPSGGFAVANGGIRTHPSTGRDKLNLDTMRSNLTLLYPNGAFQTQVQVAKNDHLNSLRHIAAAPDGTILCSFQWQGDVFDAPPLAALYRGGDAFIACELRETTHRKLNGYVGSVCALSNTAFALSAPRGAVIITLDADGRELGAHAALDACGLAASAGTTRLRPMERDAFMRCPPLALRRNRGWTWHSTTI